jgi:phosphohistidine phosphatase
MKRLILMRHAKTEPWIEGIDDHARALTPSGRQAAQQMAAALKKMGWRPDLVLVSTARRTRETWALLSAVLPHCDVRFEDDLYLAGDRGLIELLDSVECAGSIMVLGHNPGLHELCVRLSREGGSVDDHAASQVFHKLPTGAAALFEADEETSFATHAFRLSGFVRPRDLAP